MISYFSKYNFVENSKFKISEIFRHAIFYNQDSMNTCKQFKDITQLKSTNVAMLYESNSIQ